VVAADATLGEAIPWAFSITVDSASRSPHLASCTRSRVPPRFWPVHRLRRSLRAALSTAALSTAALSTAALVFRLNFIAT